MLAWTLQIWGSLPAPAFWVAVERGYWRIWGRVSAPHYFLGVLLALPQPHAGSRPIRSGCLKCSSRGTSST